VQSAKSLVTGESKCQKHRMNPSTFYIQTVATCVRFAYFQLCCQTFVIFLSNKRF